MKQVFGIDNASLWLLLVTEINSTRTRPFSKTRNTYRSSYRLVLYNYTIKRLCDAYHKHLTPYGTCAKVRKNEINFELQYENVYLVNFNISSVFYKFKPIQMIIERFECEILRASRTRLLQLLETVEHEMLFKIPQGFNNNIIWQMGHCITSQQRHMYMRSGLPMYISQEFMESFKIGSSPHSWKIIPDVNEVRHLLIDTVNHLESDLQSGLFVNYEPFKLPIGIQVKNHVQALQAANYHEAEHSGRIFTYLKLLANE